MARFFARIHALLASDSPLSVVLRRGPSKQVCTILWDRRYDKFQVGQWLKGRIYERRCDLSPDGKYLLYFAMSGKWDSETKGSWSAISRAPYLKALAVFPKGDCWNGGGLFTGKKSYWLNDGCGHTLRNTSEVTRDSKFRPSEYFGGECLSVYYPRLLRDGWKSSSGETWLSIKTLTFSRSRSLKDGCCVSSHTRKSAPRRGRGVTRMSISSCTLRQASVYHVLIGNGQSLKASVSYGRKEASSLRGKWERMASPPNRNFLISTQ